MIFVEKIFKAYLQTDFFHWTAIEVYQCELLLKLSVCESFCDGKCHLLFCLRCWEFGVPCESLATVKIQRRKSLSNDMRLDVIVATLGLQLSAYK